jgi:hypothetical protein
MLITSASTSDTFQAILCPGDVLTTECATMGGLATVWQGTAFQYANVDDEIILRHSQFGRSYSYIISYNNGALVAQGLGVVNDSYISQLNVTVSLELNNTTVECWHYSTIDTINFIKRIQIIVLATGK